MFFQNDAEESERISGGELPNDKVRLTLTFIFKKIRKVNGGATGLSADIHSLFDQPDHVVRRPVDR